MLKAPVFVVAIAFLALFSSPAFAQTNSQDVPSTSAEAEGSPTTQRPAFYAPTVALQLATVGVVGGLWFALMADVYDDRNSLSGFFTHLIAWPGMLILSPILVGLTTAYVGEHIGPGDSGPAAFFGAVGGLVVAGFGMHFLGYDAFESSSILPLTAAVTIGAVGSYHLEALARQRRPEQETANLDLGLAPTFSTTNRFNGAFLSIGGLF